MPKENAEKRLVLNFLGSRRLCDFKDAKGIDLIAVANLLEGNADNVTEAQWGLVLDALVSLGSNNIMQQYINAVTDFIVEFSIDTELEFDDWDK